MQKNSFYAFCCLIWLIGYQLPFATGQHYLKAVEESDRYFNQFIGRFSNGDILIADSFLGPLQNGGETGQVVMARMDPCGQRVWAHSYSLPSGYLEVRDFTISQAEEILAYGSYFNGEEEFLFLLRINGQEGQKAEFRLYDPQTTNGYFAYSLKTIDREWMVLGLLLNPNTGFVARFDEALFPVWAKKITPFDPNGAAIIDRDSQTMVRSGDYVFKMNKQGDFDWSWKLNIPTVNGPLETATGYLMVGHQGGLSFFFEVDSTGQLRWQSEMFPAVESSGAISLLAAGNILFTYNCPSTSGNQLCQLILIPNGEIIEQRQLLINQSINSGVLSQSIDTSNTITIAGNANAFVSSSAELKDFLLQYSLDDLTDDCLDWENVQETMPNSIPLVFDSAQFVAQDFELKMVEMREAIIDTFLYPLTELCGETRPVSLQFQENTLPCGEDWLVWLPDHRFSWTDGSMDNPRLLELPGTYQAKNHDCSDPIEVEFRLKKEACECLMHVPSAFSPNGDGINETLVFVADCQLDAIQTKIFNRFGKLVYSSHTLGEYWDGTYRQQTVASGVYVLTIQYQWTDVEGKPQQGYRNGTITLIR